MAKNIRYKALRDSFRRQKKHPPPLSIRVNEEERATLMYRANGLPLSTYIKSVLFPEGISSKPKNSNIIQKPGFPLVGHFNNRIPIK